MPPILNTWACNAPQNTCQRVHNFAGENNWSPGKLSTFRRENANPVKRHPLHTLAVPQRPLINLLRGQPPIASAPTGLKPLTEFQGPTRHCIFSLPGNCTTPAKVHRPLLEDYLSFTRAAHALPNGVAGRVPSDWAPEWNQPGLDPRCSQFPRMASPARPPFVAWLPHKARGARRL